ncbi:MAG TPA: helix-turn-helix domain-containing protein [Gemmatimonadaceae bacterium]|nr:helix-turn-helix domain-containing protein [Gemmatimonadaceae bacterium]
MTRRRGPPYAVTSARAWQVVREHNGNVSAAARALGLSWLTVRRALERPAWVDERERRSA